MEVKASNTETTGTAMILGSLVIDRLLVFLNPRHIIKNDLIDSRSDDRLEVLGTLRAQGVMLGVLRTISRVDSP
jgi:hypothetical protein